MGWNCAVASLSGLQSARVMSGFIESPRISSKGLNEGGAFKIAAAVRTANLTREVIDARSRCRSIVVLKIIKAGIPILDAFPVSNIRFRPVNRQTHAAQAKRFATSKSLEMILGQLNEPKQRANLDARELCHS